MEAAKEIRELLDLDLTICGLVKDEHHNTSNLMDDRGTIIPIEKEGPLFFLLAQMQDEVHRFAISYHRRLRKKAMTRSILDEVEGLGEVRKKAIWKKFGSLPPAWKRSELSFLKRSRKTSIICYIIWTRSKMMHRIDCG